MKILFWVVCSTWILAAQAATADTTFCNTAPISSSAGGATSGPGDPYPSSITVVGAGTSVTTVDVQLGALTHTFPDDLDLLLLGPTGARMVIQSDVGAGLDVNGLSYVISDSGATLMPDSGQLVAGTFKPTNAGSGDPFVAPAPAGPHSEAAPAGTATLTSIFANTNPNGQWKLFVVDDTVADVGTYAGGWCINVASAPVTLQMVETVRSYWPRMSERIFRNGVAATCASPKVFPGVAGSPGPFLYESVGLVAASAGCVTLDVSVTGTGCGPTGTNGIHLTAYDGHFNPADLSIGYLGDTGVSAVLGTLPSMSLQLAAGQKVGLLLTTNLAGGFGSCKASISSTGNVMSTAFTVFADPLTAGIGLPLMSTRLNRNAIESTCGAVKPFPGTVATAPVVYRSFLGIGAAGGCASIAMTTAGSGCGTSQMHLTGYGAQFDASDLSASYLGDLGQSAFVDSPQSMGIDVTTGQPLYLMANVVGTNPSAPCVASAAAFGLIRDRIFSDGMDL